MRYPRTFSSSDTPLRPASTSSSVRHFFHPGRARRCAPMQASSPSLLKIASTINCASAHHRDARPVNNGTAAPAVRTSFNVETRCATVRVDAANQPASPCDVICQGLPNSASSLQLRSERCDSTPTLSCIARSVPVLTPKILERVSMDNRGA